MTLPMERAREAVAALRSGHSLFETLAQLESRLGAACLDGGGEIAVRIEIDRSLASPIGEVLGVRIDERDPRRPRVRVLAALPGLGGTMAATSDRLREELSHGDHAAGPVLDLLHHRLAALLYLEWRHATGRGGGIAEPLRIWAEHRLHRTDSIGALGALRTPAISTETIRGLLAHLCDPVPVRVREWRPRITVLEEGLARLGPRASVLGGGAMLGPRLVEETSTIEVELGPIDPESLSPYLDDSPTRRSLHRWIAELLPAGMFALVTVRLPRPGEPTRLGGRRHPSHRLGRDTWLPGGDFREAMVPAGRVEASDVETHRRRDTDTIAEGVAS